MSWTLEQRAEAELKREQRAEGALSEYRGRMLAIRERTARPREIRLAKQANSNGVQRSSAKVRP
jgi:hypothetical protein